MHIQYDTQRHVFALHTQSMTYAFAVNGAGRLVHLYWGNKLEAPDAFVALLGGIDTLDAYGVHQTALLQPEYRVQEPFDYGEPALLCRFSDGVRSVRLRYESHSIMEDRLCITLRDEAYPLTVELRYQGYGRLDLVSRQAVITNEGDTPLTLYEMLSATCHMPSGEDYRLTHMAGSWGAEYRKMQLPVTQSKIILENRRGTCGACQQVPFFALDAKGQATETAGEVYYGVLHWSGNFKITVEKNNLDQVSVSAGINDFDTEYTLKAGERFTTPDVTLGFSAAGWERMSNTLYDLQYDYLCPRNKAYDERPIIYNSWYPYEFDLREGNMLALVEKAADVGAELFVIDDGWMPGRTNDQTGLGDWRADQNRFPHGLQPIADACHEKGMLFGLWVEPEMVNPDSDLYRQHPDWILHDPTREPSLCRNQLVLNLARDDVRDWAIAWLDQMITDYGLDYLKWDMNRYFTEYGWPQASMEDKRSVSVRYIQNLYDIWRHLNKTHPDVLFENCASGGGRADFGMVPYADRINRSDNADPVDVMLLHEGFTTLFVPKTAGGAGNIASSPNGVNGRITPLSFRIHAGMTGSMSIGINLLKSSEEELAALAKATVEFKKLRADLQDVYVYRIASALENPYSVLQYVRRDGGAFSVFAFGHGMRHWDKILPRFRMRGLKPDTMYRCDDGLCGSGSMLMNVGLAIPLKGDYDSVFLHFTAEGTPQL